MDFGFNNLAKSIEAKCDALAAILKKLEVDGGPRFEDAHLVLSWQLFIKWGFQSQGEVGDAIEDLYQCKRQAEKLAESIRKLPPILVEAIEEDSYLVTREPVDPENPTYSIVHRPEHASYESILQELVRDLDFGSRMLKDLRRDYWGEGTKGIDVLAYKIALDVGRVYVKLRNEMPGYGPGNIHKPPTPFVRTVSEVFELVGINKKPRDPCKAAIDTLKSEAAA